MAKKKEKPVYVQVAEELNELLGLDPQIDIKAKEEVIVAKIQEATELIEPEDDLTKMAEEYLAGLDEAEKKEEVEEKEVPAQEKKKAPKKAPAKEEVPEEKEKPVKKASGFNQSTCIREGLRAKKTDEQIIDELQKGTSKTKGWAKSRLLLYYKSYGEKGKDDPKL